ncbi:class I SAM-dependent methyltransferase [Catenibacterium mitsuokai]|uniref:class I SAM-dependent methyltransferase n=1 Tax=Catenibacterium faecis TaxID=2764323 RepID=UPI003D7878A8
MTDYKNLSKSAFNVQANTYDVDKTGKHARGQYKYVLNELQQLDFQKILDVGCGTGEILKSIKERYSFVQLYGLDISEEMLKQANDKLKGTATLILGDAENITLETNSFDLLLCTDSFHHYPNPQQAISEFYRVLKHGKFLLIADYWKPFPIRQIMNLFISYSNEGDVKIYSKKEIIEFLKQGGFQEIIYKKIQNSGYLVIAKKA